MNDCLTADDWWEWERLSTLYCYWKTGTMHQNSSPPEVHQNWVTTSVLELNLKQSECTWKNRECIILAVNLAWAFSPGSSSDHQVGSFPHCRKEVKVNSIVTGGGSSLISTICSLVTGREEFGMCERVCVWLAAVELGEPGATNWKCDCDYRRFQYRCSTISFAISFSFSSSVHHQLFKQQERR